MAFQVSCAEHYHTQGCCVAIILSRGPQKLSRTVETTQKTYNSGDSPILTNSTTNPPVHCLYMAERTGSLVFNVLWSYVKADTA
jgi:hypothetical protein